MPQEDDRVKAARRRFAAIQAGDRAASLSLYDENAVQVEHPNQLKPKVDCRTPPEMAGLIELGRKLLGSERYEMLDPVSARGGLAPQAR